MFYECVPVLEAVCPRFVIRPLGGFDVVSVRTEFLLEGCQCAGIFQMNEPLEMGGSRLPNFMAENHPFDVRSVHACESPQLVLSGVIQCQAVSAFSLCHETGTGVSLIIPPVVESAEVSDEESVLPLQTPLCNCAISMQQAGQKRVVRGVSSP